MPGKVITAHQPAYLPWLGYFHKIAVSDAYLFLDSVQYEKNSFTNRNKIKTPNGDAWLTIPVLTKGHFAMGIKELKIDNTSGWKRKHLKSLQFYKKAPYYSNYYGFFEETYDKNWERLADINEHITRFILKELEIKADFIKSSDLGLKSNKDELILEVCKKLGGDVFVFGAMGRDYVDPEKFRSKGIFAYFQEYRHPVYPQLWGDFIGNLSMIDLLMNAGPDRAYDIMMKDNVTKDNILKLYDRGLNDNTRDRSAPG